MENNSNEQDISQARSALAEKMRQYQKALKDDKMLKELKELLDEIRKLEAEIRRLEGKAG